MKPRTIIVAGSFAQVCTLMLAGAITVIAFSYAIGGLMCCAQSEWGGDG